jgi:hypothetical protein
MIRTKVGRSLMRRLGIHLTFAMQSVILAWPDEARMLAISNNDQKFQVLSHENHSLSKPLYQPNVESTFVSRQR